MASLTVTAKGQITLRRELLNHLGVRPGEQIELDRLPGGELRLKAVRPTGSIEGFIGRHAGKAAQPLSIEEMNRIAAAGWAGEE
ncbi:bifunctional DNA-binding transcriptional regulator/antitoxin component of YhaV-PrlF toxin-antitoxin module [Neorhizobium galegae]|uniref:AbrB/MazE/SpoVT family DNA-binding domain-containing protein n=1 Tax=Neorhizobium galegae TaxID=399 RepID=UPI001AE6517A|nr:AbrB/MazE/SpoVT family DNA-binding domain-containing protein [Neorhizobium galegae]MBP2547749.1 bifunctional DNA-binding transcriptional regulator/antitoxin component of YhaV-PrlF toxin-antitoxin module [Neorhizobium galegae]